MLFTRFSESLKPLLCASNNKALAVAVSGGVDSVAMLMLAGKFAKENSYNLLVLTVNHNLREESKMEAEYVSQLANSMGYKHFTLTWNANGNYSNLQARAREARYELLTKLCKQQNIPLLLTAHHLDDKIENLFIRINRGSGVFGLSSSNVNFYNNIKIVRPLHNFLKTELVEYLRSSGVKWYEDQSNNSSKYLRNSIRYNITNKFDNNTKDRILFTISNIDRVASLLQRQFICAIAEAITISALGYAIIDITILKQFQEEVRLQLLSHILMIISGNAKAPRFESISLLRDWVVNAEDFTKTLHGCYVIKEGHKLLIYREFGKVKPDDVTLHKGQIWDNRFCYLGGNLDERYYISSMTENEYRQIKERLVIRNLTNLAANHHKNILFTLPVVKKLEKIIALPHISYYDDKNLVSLVNFTFSPKFISRFTHF